MKQVTNDQKFNLSLYILGLIITVLLMANNGMAQTVKIDKDGNYIATSKSKQEKGKDAETGKTFTDSKGNVYPILESVNGKLYYMKTAKSGNIYRCYIRLTN